MELKKTDMKDILEANSLKLSDWLNVEKWEKISFQILLPIKSHSVDYNKLHQVYQIMVLHSKVI